MKVCVIGFGNIGAAIASQSLKIGRAVDVVSSKLEQVQYPLIAIDSTTKQTLNGQIDHITSDLESAVADATLVFITHPAFLISETLNNLKECLADNATVIILPASGGKVYALANMHDWHNNVIFLERVPMIARLSDLHHVSYAMKSEVRYFQKVYNSDNILNPEKLLPNINFSALSSMVELELITSNAILHPARLYDLFVDNGDFTQPPLFYQEWSDRASELLVTLDQEVTAIRNSFPPSTIHESESILTHYGVISSQQLTRKLRSIDSFKGIEAPVQKNPMTHLFEADYSSRYFTEDIPYGLLDFKALATILQIETPTMDKILIWAQKKLNKKYLTSLGKPGVDFLDSGVPQRFGITTKQQLFEFFSIAI